MNYSFHPLAEIEFNEAIDYYNECQFDLGKEFNEEVYSAIQTILAFPKAWSPLSNTKLLSKIKIRIFESLLGIMPGKSTF